MNALAGKCILLGVGGGLAAGASPEVVRLLREGGALVRVVMTRAACRFVAPLTLQSLSGEPVHLEEPDGVTDHEALARWADAVLVAPASAEVLARLANGLCEDLLGTLCLVGAAPLLLAPSMEPRMWLAPATQANVGRLLERGVALLGPAEGSAGGEQVGAGRMLEPVDLVEALAARLRPGSLAGLRVLVTAGPTREALDPVRYLSNRSSGRMGYAVAQAAREAGALVTLVSGPVALPTPAGVRRLDVVSAEEMLRAVEGEVGACDLLVAAAAVADFRPLAVAAHKIKKGEGALTLTLEHTPDILGRLSTLSRRPFTVGFAAETQDVEFHARGKLERKSLDMIAANDVGCPGVGFEAEENALQVYWHGGEMALPRAPKDKLARRLVALIAERYRAGRSA